jgi:tRNA threonylcarbamoyladenosine biosynthesis protein TsaB
MLILAFETSVEHASVVVAEDDQELSAWRAEAHGDLCQRLASEVRSLFVSAERELRDIDLVAVGLGPGSFTALRIGLATAKAIALAWDLPLVGVSSLAAMAWQMRRRLAGLVCPLLDAKRGECYGALYSTTPDRVDPIVPEFVAPVGGLTERLPPGEEPVTVFGQLDTDAISAAASALGTRAKHWPQEPVYPDALAVAELGRLRFAAEGGDDIVSLRPIYVRKSYAEERLDLDLGLR